MSFALHDQSNEPIFSIFFFYLKEIPIVLFYFSIVFRYKEGRVILEQALIQESDGFLDPYSTPTPVATNRYNNQNHFQD